MSDDEAREIIPAGSAALVAGHKHLLMALDDQIAQRLRAT
jgi:hypothetical protein